MSKIKNHKSSIDKDFGVRYNIPIGIFVNGIEIIGKRTKIKKIQTFGQNLREMFGLLSIGLPPNKIFNLEMKTFLKQMEPNEIFDEFPNLGNFLKEVSKPLFDFLQQKNQKIKNENTLLLILVDSLNGNIDAEMEEVIEILEQIYHLLRNEFGEELTNQTQNIEIEGVSFDNISCDLNAIVDMIKLFFLIHNCYDNNNCLLQNKFLRKDRFYIKIGYSIGS